MHGSVDRPPGNTRRGQAYDFICDELAHGRRSPSLPEIARHLKVSDTRAKQLVEQLAAEGFINRAAGAQRAIAVPGAAVALAIGILRAQGWAVDEDMLEVGPGGFPKMQLPQFPDLIHIPEALMGDGDGSGSDDQQQRAGTAEVRTPGAGAAATGADTGEAGAPEQSRRRRRARARGGGSGRAARDMGQVGRNAAD